MADLSPLTFGTVTGRFLAGVADSNDAGVTPDVEPLEGYVEFTMSAAAVRVTTADPVPVTLFPTAIRADLDADGYISHNGSQGITLLATDDPATNPTDLQWKASFFLKRGNNAAVSYPSFNFALPAGSTVDLSVVAPLVEPAPNTIITKGDKGDKGDPGDAGTPDIPGGTTGQALVKDSDADGDFSWQDVEGTPGDPGKSAYEVAVDNGFVGTEAEWLTSLHGTDGEDGTDGNDGHTPVVLWRNSGGYIQNQTDGGEWTNVVALADISGTDGIDGTDGTDGTDGDDGASVTVTILDDADPDPTDSDPLHIYIRPQA